ncbi:MAG: hypothetical protein WKG07_00345 [Hymenobacter sp.]
MMARLDYLRDLGINCIEMMPATEFPGSLFVGLQPVEPVRAGKRLRRAGGVSGSW